MGCARNACPVQVIRLDDAGEDESGCLAIVRTVRRLFDPTLSHVT